jgi:type II secretory pathway pseudopilin PulG
MLVMIATFSSKLPRLGSQAGDTLIEVVISALLVGVIVVGVFTGLNSAGRASSDERAHNQATLIAQQDEDRLRGLTATELSQLGSKEAYRAENGDCLEKVSGTYDYWNQINTTFCEKATGLAGTAYTATVYTVKSSESYVTAGTGGNETFTCETSGAKANYIQTTSSVTWRTLGSRAPVSQSSLVAVSASAALIVKVVNQNNEPVEGATATVTDPSTASTPTATETTPASGCVIFGGLTAGTVSATAAKTGWVEHNGKSPATSTPVTLTANTTTEAPTFTIAEPGSIVAEFESAGTTVTGDTFYALQTQMSSPQNFVGGTAGKYESRTELAKLLFPFKNIAEKPPGPAPYTVFAGDCEANNPATVTATGEKLKDPTAQVEPNGSTPVKLEVPAVNVTVYEGTSSANGSPITGKPEHAMIINKGCEAATAQNYSGKVPYEHPNLEFTSGHLVQKYQPYAKELQLCIVADLSNTYYKYKSPVFENKVKAGTTIPSVYMKNTEKVGEYEHTTVAGKLTCP